MLHCVPSRRRIALLTLVGLAMAGAWPAAASEVVFTKFKGSITDVGVLRGPGQIGGVEFRIEGTFLYDGQVDFSRAVVTFIAMMLEEGAGGGGELMRTVDMAHFLPLAVPPDDSNEPEDGLYETPNLRPRFRLNIERRNPEDQEIEFKLKVDRALARERPRLCVGSHPDKRTTHLTHTFTFDDGVNPPLRVSTVQTWVCTKPDRYHMRTP